jgi:hypothetical protein
VHDTEMASETCSPLEVVHRAPLTANDHAKPSAEGALPASRGGTDAEATEEHFDGSTTE